MSYQLEILWYQAERMRSLGWADYLKVDMTNDRKTLTISYWMYGMLFRVWCPSLTMFDLDENLSNMCRVVHHSVTSFLH